MKLHPRPKFNKLYLYSPNHLYSLKGLNRTSIYDNPLTQALQSQSPRLDAWTLLNTLEQTEK